MVGKQANIFLEDVLVPSGINFVAATSDSKGHFELRVFDGTRYRVHAISRDPEIFSSEPWSTKPDTVASKPVHVVLTAKGRSAFELASKRFEQWRKGLGLD